MMRCDHPSPLRHTISGLCYDCHRGISSWRIVGINRLSQTVYLSADGSYTPDINRASTFTTDERYRMRLPRGGRWLPVEPERDRIQI